MSANITTVNEARTILLDKDGNVLPVPAGTDPHLEKKQKTEVRDQGSGTSAPAAQKKTEPRPPIPDTRKGGKS
uniref:Uncharacterized protein n=1 Tax=viral metagenome TaxID=1070528 RepID=A0A6M3LCJ0_9ZZZZ